MTPESRKRNIPAYAGKTSKALMPISFSAEHPRVCGENVGYDSSIKGYGGTSPRMRGKRVFLFGGLGFLRNIPAYAGKTDTDQSGNRSGAEHPRVCGENGTQLYP